MAEQMKQIRDPDMSCKRYDLRNADERISEIRAYIVRERAKLRRLQAHPGEAIGIRGVLSALERTLRYFLDHRSWIEEQLKRA